MVRLTVASGAATLWRDHYRLATGGDSFVTRRFALILVALLATASVVLAACGAGTPALPALTDPKDILTASILSLKDVKSVEFTGSFTGSIDIPELGTPLDLSTVKLSGAADIDAKKAKFSLDAPTLLGTKIDALVLDNVAYYKIAGPLAAMMGGSADLFTKVDVPEASGKPVTDAAELDKQIDEFKAGLDKLPTPPTKGADEKCGDQDCYHVTLKLTAADLKALDPTADAGEGDFSLDLWTRKNDRRPAKLAISVVSAEIGTVGMTFEIKYDVAVSVEAPSANQIAP
jgi:hypothetical protein